MMPNYRSYWWKAAFPETNCLVEIVVILQQEGLGVTSAVRGEEG